jgi:hypothetical protein
LIPGDPSLRRGRGAGEPDDFDFKEVHDIEVSRGAALHSGHG